MWNVATDLAINSIIIKNAGASHGNSNGRDDRPLPRCALVPGSWPTKPDGREMSNEEKDAAKLAALIASFPEMQSSEWYFNKLQEFAQENPGGLGGDGEWVDSLDDHDGWDEVPEEHREYVEGKVKSIVEKAVREADATSTGWGNVPHEIRDDIRRSVSNIINWRQVLRQFVGTLVRCNRTTSIKRINRRYPYIHPGIKRGWQAKLLIAMDQSGSVYNAMLEEFFSELGSLTKKIDISILPFDSHCDEKDIYEWKKGQALQAKRTRAGGTDFNAPTRVFNDPKNRGRWDGLLIMTDGCAPQPGSTRGKRGWVLGQGCTIPWNTSELQIFLTKGKQMTGAWR
jgi:predicted metal-dependent peptidase